MHKYTGDEDLPVFWPFFSHDSMPVKEGEFVYVIFEDAERTHGLWMTRIAEPNKINDLNLTPAIKRFQANTKNDTTINFNQAIQDSDVPVTPITGSKDFTVEKVPEYQQRAGDRVFAGSNNTLIVLSRDRVDTIESGEKQEAGTIDIVVGRNPTSNDISISEDKSRIYVSMKTDVDVNFATDQIAGSSGPVAAIGVKSDEIRIVGQHKWSGTYKYDGAPADVCRLD
jgi:hypothetical protein